MNASSISCPRTEHAAPADAVVAPAAPASPAVALRPATLLERLGRTAILNRLAGLRSARLEFHEGGRSTVVGAGPTTLRIDIHDPSAWADFASGGTVGSGAAYIAGIWSCPDLVALMRLLIRDRATLDGLEGGFARLFSPLQRLWHWSRANTISGSRANIAAHYDLGNDFFAQWLDPGMTYSSAWWPQPDLSLEEAQSAKIDRLCRMLDLGPDDHLLEIGTGWGAFAIHAASRYGCRVTTTTISQRQWEVARERVAAAGLSARVAVELQDYRALTGTYDKLVSVEMIEAVGHRFYPTFFATCARLLKPEGAMAMQAITIAERQFASALRAVDFIQAYVFPGCCIPSLGALSAAMGRASDFDIVAVHDLTPDYARTLALWRQNFNAAAATIAALGHGEDFQRLWNFYLAYCEGGFAERAIGCTQILYARGGWRSAAQRRADGGSGAGCDGG